jgi:hypothetical protein
VSLIDAVLLARAEEQMESGAWRRKDRDEANLPKPPVECVICHVEIGHGKQGNKKLCAPCRDAGWAGSPCKGCGGRLRRNDQTRDATARRGFCAACRDAMPMPPGNRRMAAAHAELARRRAERRAA